jgi:hypothetical protein
VGPARIVGRPWLWGQIGRERGGVKRRRG